MIIFLSAVFTVSLLSLVILWASLAAEQRRKNSAVGRHWPMTVGREYRQAVEREARYFYQHPERRAESNNDHR